MFSIFAYHRTSFSRITRRFIVANASCENFCLSERLSIINKFISVFDTVSEYSGCIVGSAMKPMLLCH